MNAGLSLYSTFAFQGLRIDEALRLYLEAFRLPGEAPVIQRLLETFTDNWHVSQLPCTHSPWQGHSAMPKQAHTRNTHIHTVNRF